MTHFSRSLNEILEISLEKAIKLTEITYDSTTARLNAIMGTQMIGPIG